VAVGERKEVQKLSEITRGKMHPRGAKKTRRIIEGFCGYCQRFFFADDFKGIAAHCGLQCRRSFLRWKCGFTCHSKLRHFLSWMQFSQTVFCRQNSVQYSFKLQSQVFFCRTSSSLTSIKLGPKFSFLATMSQKRIFTSVVSNRVDSLGKTRLVLPFDVSKSSVSGDGSTRLKENAILADGSKYARKE
jgi:hypothetical protein